MKYSTTHLIDEHETVNSYSWGLWNKILRYWFPAAKPLDVSLYWITPHTTKDRRISFVIHRSMEPPLLIVEVKPPYDFHVDQKREAAITQITERLDVIGPTNLYPRLYAISAIGKRWRVSYVAKGKGSKGGQPVKGIAAVNSLRSADQDCWNPDVTSVSSWEALRRIVATIKGYATYQAMYM